MLAILGYLFFAIAGALVAYSLVNDLRKLARLLRAERIQHRRAAAIGRRLGY